MQDTESRFREILDRVSRYITGYSDIPVASTSRYLQLPDLFNTSRHSESSASGIINGRNELVRQVSEARSITPLIEDRSEPANEGDRPRPEENVVSFVTQHTGRRVTSCAPQQPRDSNNTVPSAEDIISGDNISVITRARLANRVTNCVVCTIS